MQKKQIIGLVVAAVVFSGVCISSYFANSYDSQRSKMNMLSALLEEANSISTPMYPFVGVIKVEGTIQASSASSLYSTATYDHDTVLESIEAYESSEFNKGILLYLNTPGGAVYETDEVYLRLKEYSENTGRPIWAYMASEACSGGYYMAMAADKIFANRNAWTGSIGVIMSLVNYKELYDKLGIESVVFASGPNKAMGSATLEMTEEQSNILQSLIDESYEQFVEIVAEGRSMTKEQVLPIADGRIYTAKQALDLKLIDEISQYDEFLASYKEFLGQEVEFFAPKINKTGFEALFSIVSELSGLVGKSDLEAVSDMMENDRNGVLMYYESFQK